IPSWAKIDRVIPTNPVVVRTPKSHFIEFPPSTESLAQGSRVTKSLGYCADYTGNPPAGLHGFVTLLHGIFQTYCVVPTYQIKSTAGSTLQMKTILILVDRLKPAPHNPLRIENEKGMRRGNGTSLQFAWRNPRFEALVRRGTHCTPHRFSLSIWFATP